MDGMDEPDSSAADPRADDVRELGDGESLSHVPGRADGGNAARRGQEPAGACTPKRAGVARREVASRRWGSACGSGGDGGWESKGDASDCVW